MAIINSTRVPVDRFTWMPEEKLLVAEASDLPPLTQVWDDACDEGLTVYTRRTPNGITFAVDHEERDREGDVLYWDLRPAKLAERGLCTVRIFND